MKSLRKQKHNHTLLDKHTLYKVHWTHFSLPEHMTDFSVSGCRDLEPADGTVTIKALYRACSTQKFRSVYTSEAELV